MTRPKYKLHPVAVSCGRCGTQRRKDVPATSAEEAVDLLRQKLNTEDWDCDEGGALCPTCHHIIRHGEASR